MASSYNIHIRHILNHESKTLTMCSSHISCKGFNFLSRLHFICVSRSHVPDFGPDVRLQIWLTYSCIFICIIFVSRNTGRNSCILGSPNGVTSKWGLIPFGLIKAKPYQNNFPRTFWGDGFRLRFSVTCDGRFQVACLQLFPTFAIFTCTLLCVTSREMARSIDSLLQMRTPTIGFVFWEVGEIASKDVHILVFCNLWRGASSNSH